MTEVGAYQCYRLRGFRLAILPLVGNSSNTFNGYIRDSTVIKIIFKMNSDSKRWGS